MPAAAAKFSQRKSCALLFEGLPTHTFANSEASPEKLGNQPLAFCSLELNVSFLWVASQRDASWVEHKHQISSKSSLQNDGKALQVGIVQLCSGITIMQSSIACALAYLYKAIFLRYCYDALLRDAFTQGMRVTGDNHMSVHSSKLPPPSD